MTVQPIDLRMQPSRCYSVLCRVPWATALSRLGPPTTMHDHAESMHDAAGTKDDPCTCTPCIVAGQGMFFRTGTPAESPARLSLSPGTYPGSPHEHAGFDAGA